jgi:pimeloyl-ACP methyl ester carboxylesterase
MGGDVALRMVAQRPHRVRALILTGYGYLPVKEYASRRSQRYREMGLAARHRHALDDFGPQFRDTRLGHYFASLFCDRPADVDTLLELYRALQEPDPATLLDAIRVPVLILTGSEDNAHLPALELQKRLAECELVTLQGAGHACNMEQPWEFDAEIIRFMERRGLLQTARE